MNELVITQDQQVVKTKEIGMNKFIEVSGTLLNVSHIKTIEVFDLTEDEAVDYGESQKLVINLGTEVHSVISSIDSVQEMYEEIKSQLITE